MSDVAQYDYVIVGAGSAGCVVANRLSADAGVRVLLLEGGPADSHPLIHIPRGFGKMVANPRYTRLYKVNKTGGHNQPEYWVRGSTMGGSSSVNGMVYVRGLPSDFDEWHCPGWTWDEISKAFRAIEDHEEGASDWHGAGGPLKISFHPGREPLCEAFLDAAAQAGTPRAENLNRVDRDAVGYLQRTIHRGRRQSAAKAFLTPAVRARANLTIVAGAEVQRILFDGRRAIGVELIVDGQRRSFAAAREVIVAAGALNSPKLLQLSGIGPADHLRRLGIEILVDSPEVGANLREHRLLLQQFEVSEGSQNFEFSGWRLLRSLLGYGLFRTGPFASAAFEIGGFVRSRESTGRPDVQIVMGLIARDRGKMPAFLPDSIPSVSCGGFVMRPESRGSVMITGPEPEAPLAIDPNYLSAERDRQISIDAVRWVRQVFSQPALARYRPREYFPGPDYQSDEQIIDAFHKHGGAGYHAAGTCRMGTDDRSVLDTSLRVRGVDGLRVVDIAMMPALVSGNTNGPAMAIGWRAADLIEEDRHQ